jgi:hypothetical protein
MTELKYTALTFVLSTSTSSAMLVGGPWVAADVLGLLLLVVAVLLLLLAAAVSDEFRAGGSGALLCYE